MNQEEKKEKEQEKEQESCCTICLEPIGRLWPQKPNLGSMCIECAQEWNGRNKDNGKELKDPATFQILPRCPYCSELITMFNRYWHFSKCSQAPDDVQEMFAALPETERMSFIFLENEKYSMSKDSWQHLVAMKKLQILVIDKQK